MGAMATNSCRGCTRTLLGQILKPATCARCTRRIAPRRRKPPRSGEGGGRGDGRGVAHRRGGSPPYRSDSVSRMRIEPLETPVARAMHWRRESCLTIPTISSEYMVHLFVAGVEVIPACL